MTEGYTIVEAQGFCIEYMQEFKGSTQRVWDDKEDPTMYDEILEGSRQVHHLSFELQQWVYEFVVNNVAPLENWRR